MPAARTTKSTTKKRSATTSVPRRSARINKVNQPPEPITDLAVLFPVEEGLNKIDDSFENPDVTHAKTAPICDGITMRVYPWSVSESALVVDFVHPDGTRVEGPTDWSFWYIGPYPPSRMERYGEHRGFSYHVYNVLKQYKYEVRRSDGTVIRSLVFPPQPFEII